jgi:hypothetical protein
LRATVTALAVVISGFAGPLALPASADEPTAAPVSYLVSFAAGTSADEQTAVLADAGATDVDAIPQLRMHAVTLPADSASSVADSLRALASVTNVNLDRTRVAEATPDDPAYADQWALPKIGWDTARDAVTPAGSSVVAVLDTGVDGTHADLSGQLVAGTSVLEGGDPLVDPNGHGTAMAGIVAADTNNGRGIAGVGYQGVKVMPVTVLGADGTGQDSDIISGVVWAADHGADVILMSFSNPGYSAALQAALDYAWSNGAVLVAATGNDGSSTATFPAGSEGVVGVSSTNEADELASSSNYGADTFLAAPGVGIVTTQAGGGTTSVTGTSAAAAIVAGSAGLLAAADDSAGPGVIVGRLARHADAAGTADQTGNGRVNLGRSVSDTSTAAVKPDGAAPVGDGGPLVGPYVAAAKNLTLTFAGTGGGTISFSNLTPTGPVTSCTATCTRAVDNNQRGRMTATPSAGSTFVGWTGTWDTAKNGTTTCAGAVNPCDFFMGDTGGADQPGLIATFALAAPAPTKLAIPSVNGGVNPVAGTPFSVTVVAQDSGGTSRNVSAATSLTLTRTAGTGALGGTLTGTIAAGTSSVTFNNVTYTKAEPGVVLTATRTSGDTLASGSSPAFTVVAGTAAQVALSASPPGDLTSGAARTLTATIQDANGNTVTSGPGSSLSVLFSQTNSGGGSVSGLGSAGASGGVATKVVIGNAAGLVQVAADAGAPALNRAPGNPLSFNVVAAAQSITFAPPGPRTYGETFNVNPTASSGLTVSVIATGGCTALAVSPGYDVTMTSGSADCVLTASQAGNTFFAPAPNVVLTVAANKKALSVTADAVIADPAVDHFSKVYGSANPAFSVRYVGFAFTDGPSSLGGTLAFDTAATTTSPVGPYVVTPKGLTSSNYTITFVDGTLDVTKKALSVNGVAASKTYGAADPGFTWTYSGFITGQDATNVTITGNAACTRTGGESVAGSPYSITCASGTLSAANYSFTTGSTANFTINKKTLSVDAVADSKIYGAADPVFSWTFSGFITGESSGNVTISGAASCSRTAGSSVAGSPYTITCAPGTLSSANYGFVTGSTANFTISKQALSVDAVADSKTYGDADPAFSWTFSGFTSGEDATNVTISGAADCSRTEGETVAGGPYEITCEPGDLEAANYSFTTGATANFTINKRFAAWNTDANSKTYGDTDPSPLTTGSGAGFLPDDGVNATYSRASGESVAGSPYHITATLSSGVSGALDNYTISNDGAGFTINKKTLSVDAVAHSKTYGASDPAFTWALSGFASGEDATNVTISGDAVCTRIAGETVTGGPYTITCAPGDLEATNYSFTTGDTANFTISTKAASVTPDAQTKVYGSADAVLTGTLSGFLAGDGVSATYSRTAGATVAGGPYTISATLSPSGVLDNYDITYNTANFTITKKTASVTPDAQTKVYGSADAVLTGTLSGFLAADGVSATYSRTAGATVAGGPYTISATLSPIGVLDNYDITYNTANFTITKKTASVTPDAQTKVYGSADAVLTGTLSGFLAADSVSATYSRTAGTTVTGGPYTISATLSPSGVLNNYDITYNTASFTITQKDLSVDAVADSKSYGAADPVFSWTFSGFITGENAGNVTIVGAASCSRTAGESVAGSPYTITCGLGSLLAANYSFVTGDTADFTITKKSASVTPAANSKTYGAADPELTGTIVGFLAADGVSATYSRTAGESVAGGPYTISATLSPSGVLNNYDITYNTATFTINKKSLSVNAVADSKTYGASDPVFDWTLSGFVSGENATSAGITGLADCSRTTGESVAGSPYTITCAPGDLEAANYSFVTGATADFTISKKAASVTPDAKSKTYGAADPVLTGTLVGFLSADTVTATYTRAPGETVAGGPYTVSAMLSPSGVLGNYDITYNTASLTINRKSASVTPAANSKSYGAADPALTGTLVGFLSADGVTATYSRTAGETVAGSPYTVSAMLSPSGVLGNYDITYNTASFTIDQKALSVTANNRTKIYGEVLDLGTGAFATSGLVTGDAVTAVTLTSAGVGAAANVGSYAVVPSAAVGTGLANYTISYVDGSLTVGAKTLSVNAVSGSKTYGAADPAFGWTYAGFVNGQDATSAGITGAASCTRTAGQTVAGGPYVITCAPGTLSAANYRFETGHTASFTIDQKAASVTPAANSKTYGAADPALTGTLVGFLAADGVTATYSRAPGETVAGGPYTISATLSPSGVLGNYDITYNTASFTINKKSLSVTADADAATAAVDRFTKLLGSANPSFTVRYEGFVLGQNSSSLGGALAFQTLATAASPVGPYDVTPSGLTSSNYAITFVKGTLAILYGWNGFLQPINDTAHQTGVNESKFKLGQTIPTKFVITDATGTVVTQSSNPTFARSGNRGSCDSTATLESVATIAADTVAEFRLTGGQYLYGWSTKGLTAGEYRIYADLADGSSPYVDICLTK